VLARRFLTPNHSACKVLHLVSGTPVDGEGQPNLMMPIRFRSLVRALPLLGLLATGKAHAGDNIDPTPLAGSAAEMVFIDAAVEDRETLASHLRNGLEPVLLQPDESAVAQMQQHLQGRHGLRSIRLISHAEPGALWLSGQRMDAAGLQREAAAFGEMGQALQPGGDFQLFGCDLAAGRAGEAFVREFAQVTGKPVAASTNKTGATALGGDWVLEAQVGKTTASAPIFAAGFEYRGVLPVPITGIDPSTNPVFVRPGGISNTWTYGPYNSSGNAPIIPDGPATVNHLGWIGNGTSVLTRGKFQYTTDGSNWIDITYNSTPGPTIAGKTYRFVDQLPADTTTNDSFFVVFDYVSYIASTSAGQSVLVDNPPTDVFPNTTDIWGTPVAGDQIAVVSKTDTGTTQGGGYEFVGQSVANLFSLNTSTLNLTLGSGTLPAPGGSATVTLRYYDYYQTDNTGTPIAGQGISKTITMTRRSNPSGFGSDLHVNTFTTNAQSQPQVVGLSDGSFVVVWRSLGEDGETTAQGSIYAQKYTAAGATSGTEFIINASLGKNESNPVVAPLSGGRFVVAYQQANTDADILFRIVAANGSMGSETLVPVGTGAQTNPTIAALPNDNFVIAWIAPNGADTGDVYARVFDSSGAAATGDFVVNTTTTGTQGNPSVAGLSNNTYVVAWRDPDNNNDVRARVMNGSTPVSSEIAVNTSATSQVNPRVAGLTGGGFVVTYSDDNQTEGTVVDSTSQSNIYAIRYNNSGVVQGTRFLVNSATLGNQINPAISPLSGGGFIVGWISNSDPDGTNGLFAKRFTSTGTAVDSYDFQLNQRRVDIQSALNLGALASDSFATAWADNTLDGTGNAGIGARVFTAAVTPTITSISPTAGPTGGGNSVVITGTGFTGTTGAAGVKFGATNATSYTVNSNTQITAVAPAGSAGTVDITVTNGTTSATSSADQYTYVTAPTVTAVSPTAGPTGGSTTVTITGTGFAAAPGTGAVKFGAATATYTINSNTQITATSPANSAGTYDVTVTTPGGTSATSAADQFTYVAAPTVTSISPTSGPGAGGTVVTITGTNFSGATAVTFGATAATGFTVNSTTSITATSPAGTGTVDLRVTTVGGTSATSAADQFTYIPAPTITSISPTAGPTAGGTTVTLTGTNFTGVTAVTFGGTVAAGFTFNSTTSITATSPAGTGTVDIRVTTPGGTSATSAADQFTFVARPTVTSISPTAGPTAGGTTVIITGTGFSAASPTGAVKFGATSATYTINSNTQITATSPAGTGTVDATVTTTGGTSATSAADQFTYVPAPTVTGISPTSGPGAGGTVVTITGTNFSGATAVTFGATAATGFTVNSTTSITATSPAGTGTVDLRVTTVGGTSATSAADQFTYIPAPTITSISPTAGPATGGTTVTLTGTNFTGATAVTFGGTAAAGFTVNSTTSITATSPAGTGTVDIRVTTPGGTSATSAADQFTFVARPTVTSISPTAGPTGGGTTVIITGTGFSAASPTGAVKFGATNASYTINSNTQITATSPAGSAGIVDVTVTTAGGTSATSAADQFTYVAAPTVTAVSPTVGPTGGGTTVTITGTGFSTASPTGAVKFGAANASYTINSNTQITATSPAAVAATYDITVTNPGGASATSAADQFTYVPAPTVTSISPNAGPATGGTIITITGTNFTGATAVNFGGTAATSFTVNSSTSITATSPATSAGTVDVRVATVGGFSATSAADQFTFVAAPVVTSISPTAGPTVGGTSVTITGANFSGATAVTFGATAATGFTVNSSTSITATSPAGTGIVDVRVTTIGGTSATSAADQFAYRSADLSITKTDGVTTAVPGGSVTYTITASNAGPDDVTGAVVADTFPAILTANWTGVGAGGGTVTAMGSGNINDTVNLPAGGSVTYTVTATISSSATGTLSNTATVSVPSGVADPNPANNSATDSDTLTPQADLSITKTDGVTTATPSGTVTYTVTASNAGPSDAPGVTVADTLPASLTATWSSVAAGGSSPATNFGSGNINDTVNLPPGGSVTYTVTATLDSSASGTLSNTATVSAPGGVTDPVPANNSATDTDALATVVSITATDSTADENTGNTGTWRVTRNTTSGDLVVQLAIDPASGASETDWTQTGANLSSLAPGSTGTVTIPDGSTYVDITLTPIDDISAEPAETVQLDINPDAAYTVISPSNAAVIIDTNDFVVTNTNDRGEGSLRQAIENANLLGGAPTITFDATVTGTIALTSTNDQIDISSEMTIQGPGAKVLSVSGGNLSRVFGINTGDTVTISGLTIRDGRTFSGGGAGIRIGSGTVIVTACAIVNNDASLPGQGGQVGGGIYNENGTLTVRDSTIANNAANDSGGGIQSGGGVPLFNTVTILNSTIANNHTGLTGYGGGVSVAYHTLKLINCTVVGNSANYGGNLADDGGSITLGNTIVAGGALIGDNPSAPDISANPTSQGYNLIGNNAGINSGPTNGVNGDQVGTAAAPLDPLLGALADNGGPTQTILPQTGSPVIDAGNPALAAQAGITTDQRGFPRVDGGSVEIGAVEKDVTAPSITVPSDITMEATGHLTPVTFTVSATDTVDGPLTPTIDHASGSDFPVGDTTVTVSATDNAGNSATRTFHVIIEDTVPPVLAAHDDVLVVANSLYTTVTFDLPMATDLTNTTVVAAPQSNTIFPVGTTLVTVAATDEGGNTDTTTFNVTVRLEKPFNTTVATSGQPVIGATGGPGAPPTDAKWVTFGPPAIDDQGHLAFASTYGSTTGGKGSGLFSSLACLGLVGGPAPGGAGTFKAFSDPVIDDGITASIVSLNGVPKGTSAAILTALARNVAALPENGVVLPPVLATLIVRSGDVATPDGATFKSFKSVEIRDGFVGFTAALNLNTGTPKTTAATDTGLWVYPGTGSPVLMLREGQTIDGRKVKSFVALDSSAGSRGQGRGWLLVLGDTLRVQARVTYTNGTLALLNIDLVAGVPQITTLIESNTVFSGGFFLTGGFGFPATNFLGGRAFLGTLSSDRGPAPAIFSSPDGVDFDLLAYRTQQALSSGAKYSKLLDPVLATDGGLAFAATLSGGGVKGATANTLWWQAPGGELSLFAQGGLATGGAPTDLPVGAQFNTFTSLAIAANRGPIFTATLVPGKGGIAKTATSAAFALDGEGKIRRLFGLTDPIDFGGGTMKPLKSFTLLSPTVGNTGVTRSFNDAQQITWRATFADKTQAIVTTVVP